MERDGRQILPVKADDHFWLQSADAYNPFTEQLFSTWGEDIPNIGSHYLYRGFKADATRQKLGPGPQ